MSYCDPSDLPLYGLSATALAPIPLLTQQAACDEASEICDTYFRDRYQLPLVAWGIDVRGAAAKIAVYNLMSTRGFNVSQGADQNIRLRYEDTLKWLLQVARQEVQANVTPTQDQAPGYDDPSVVTNQPRGWDNYSSPTKIFV